MVSNFEVVLLAAGISRRMGEVNKLLLPIDDVPLIKRTANLYCTLGMKVSVVVGFESERIMDVLDGLPVKIVENQHYQSGQQSSVACGLRSVRAQGEGVLVALADQPLLTSQDIVELCDCYTKMQKIIVPFKGEARGNPVILPIHVVEFFQQMNSPVDVRNFIDQNPGFVHRYMVTHNHYHYDLDNPDDVADWEKRHEIQ